MTRANTDIRDMAAASNVLLWQIADRLKITDATFSRKLRKELSTEEKADIFAIIECLKNAQK